jgi:hypothetical protein
MQWSKGIKMKEDERRYYRKGMKWRRWEKISMTGIGGKGIQ